MNISAILKKWALIMFLIVPTLRAIEITWDTEIPISPVDDTASSLSRSRQRCVAVGNDGRIHIVWSAQNSPYPECSVGIWYAHTAGPHGWTTSCISQPIYSPYGYYYNSYNTDPSIAIINPGQVHVWWDGFREDYSMEFGIYGTSPNNGGSWQYPIDPLIWQYWAAEPPSGYNSLSTDGENCLLFFDYQWMPDSTRYFLFGGFSVDAGTTWERGPWLGWVTPGKSDINPCTACDTGDTGYIVWRSQDESNHFIIPFAKFHLEYGSPIDTATLVSYPGSGERDDAFIESDLAENLYVVWSDSRDGNDEIYFKMSTDRGETWTMDTRLTANPASSTDPALKAGSRGQIFIAWIDNRDGNPEVYFKYSEDSGATWSADTRLTNDPGTCSKTHFAISPDKLNLYIVWNDSRDGQEEVYFKKGTITVGISELSQLQKEYEFEISPNPFHQTTSIEFKIPCANPPKSMADQTNSRPRVNLKIYDATGRLVKSFAQLSITQLPNYQITWSGRDDLGRAVPAGVYFVRLELRDFEKTEKVILLR